MNPNSVYAGEDDVAVVEQKLDLNQAEWLLRLEGQVKYLDWWAFVIVCKVSLKENKCIRTYTMTLKNTNSNRQISVFENQVLLFFPVPSKIKPIFWKIK